MSKKLSERLNILDTADSLVAVEGVMEIFNVTFADCFLAFIYSLFLLRENKSYTD